METLKLDTTQNRNLTFAKVFAGGLLILWGASLAFSQKPELTAHDDDEPAPKSCQRVGEATCKRFF